MMKVTMRRALSPAPAPDSAANASSIRAARWMVTWGWGRGVDVCVCVCGREGRGVDVGVGGE